MEGSVIRLRVEEPARFNAARLEALCAEVGEHRAEHEVACALEEMSLHLKLIAAAGCDIGRADLEPPVRALIRAADMIGMASLSQVGGDVLRCLDLPDPVALSATLCRLRRVGDRSVHALWDLEDLSG